ncbi:MAG: IS3 family transposase [Spirochaetes bacterium]|jgi:putative transposase|nr:IS3 family transposase [Spirochaetota bacterium]
MIEPNHDELSVREQCLLLELNRSTLYYAPRKIGTETDTLMRRIDELHTAHITWGSRKIRDALRLEGWVVNRKRVQRLMRLMRLRVVFPQSHHDRLPPDHEVYPYLLRGVSVDRPNQVWSIDLTYIRLGDGFVYLTAIIDWYSRRILTWDVSLTLDKSSAIEVLERAMRWYGAPEIFNCDQGVQFTSPTFVEPLKDASVQISMDGKGRALDNVIIERFWRTIKYDEVYLNDYASPAEARERIADYISMYNGRRPHDALGGKTPDMAYAGDRAQAAA